MTESLQDEMFEDMYRLAENIVQQVCDKVIALLNEAVTPDILLLATSEYPDDFTTFDVLSIEFQSNSFSDINPMLEDYIDNSIMDVYDELSPSEKFILNYTYTDDLPEQVNLDYMRNEIYNAFIGRLNDNYDSEKIDDYLWSIS